MRPGAALPDCWHSHSIDSVSVTGALISRALVATDESTALRSRGRHPMSERLDRRKRSRIVALLLVATSRSGFPQQGWGPARLGFHVGHEPQRESQA
jgi:hypothetical protein